MRPIVLALLLAGCSVTPPEGAVSFVINQQTNDKGNETPGKSYDFKVSHLALAARKLTVQGGTTGDHLMLEATVADGGSLEQQLGKSLPLSGGSIAVGGKTLPLSSGFVIVQSIAGGVARGNFNARVRDQQPPWEAVGNFEALLSP